MKFAGLRFCNKVAWLENGEVVAFGEVEDVLDRYVANMIHRVAAE